MLVNTPIWNYTWNYEYYNLQVCLLPSIIKKKYEKKIKLRIQSRSMLLKTIEAKNIDPSFHIIFISLIFGLNHFKV